MLKIVRSLRTIHGEDSPIFKILKHPKYGRNIIKTKIGVQVTRFQCHEVPCGGGV